MMAHSLSCCNNAVVWQVDVWSLAVLAFEMLYSFPTFGANEKSDVKAMIEQSIMVSKPRFFPEIREISNGAASAV